MTKPTITGLRVLAIDGSLNNFGVALGYFTSNFPMPQSIHLLSSAPTKSQKILNDARRIRHIKQFLEQFEYDVAIAELPYGSKSYRAAWSLGITLAINCTLKQPLLFVTPYEVKNIVEKGADKKAMIQWARGRYPDLQWLHTNAQNEHMADAIAVMHAGYTKLKTGRYELL